MGTPLHFKELLPQLCPPSLSQFLEGMNCSSPMGTPETDRRSTIVSPWARRSRWLFFFIVEFHAFGFQDRRDRRGIREDTGQGNVSLVWNVKLKELRFNCRHFWNKDSKTSFRWDRQWLVINYKGRAYTQRVEPKLALVEVQLPNEAFLENWEPTGSSYLA